MIFFCSDGFLDLSETKLLRNGRLEMKYKVGEFFFCLFHYRTFILWSFFVVTAWGFMFFFECFYRLFVGIEPTGTMSKPLTTEQDKAIGIMNHFEIQLHHAIISYFFFQVSWYRSLKEIKGRLFFLFHHHFITKLTNLLFFL